MNSEVPLQDILFGAAVLAVFLVCALIIGRFLSSIKNRRFTRAWSPLIPLIQGKVSDDGGGAATSWLNGSYRGQRIVASMIPGRNRYLENGETYNYFDVALLDLPGKHDWRIEYKTKVIGLGSTGWQIDTKNQLLKDRLEMAGVPARLQSLGSPTLDYSTSRRLLLYSEDVTPRWLPTPERFTEELDLLLLLATLHQELNQA